MLIRKRIFISLFIILLISGCQSKISESRQRLFPTPFHETLEADKVHPSITAISLPTPTLQHTSTNQTENEGMIPSENQLRTTEIFPQDSQSSQHAYSYQTGHQELSERINNIISQSGGRWHIVIKEVGGPVIYSLLPDQRIHIASVVKLPLALLFFAALEEKGVPENQLETHIQATGTGGRTFEQLLVAMLVKSEEDATAVLAEYTSAYLNIPAKMREWQLQDIDLKARRNTVAGIASLFEKFYQGEYISPTAQDLILGYLSEYTPNDDTRIGTLRNIVPQSFQIYNKRGSLLAPYVVADCGILENPNGNDFIIAIFAYNSDPKTTYENLDQAIGEIVLAFWDLISRDNQTLTAP
jgi:beta-lactamase class A